MGIFLMAYLSYTIIEIKYVDFDYKVKGPAHIGFNAGTDALHLGIIQQGGSAHRDLILISEKRARILVKVYGDDYVKPDENDFIMEAGQEKYLRFSVQLPRDIAIGNYSGKIRIVFKRP